METQEREGKMDVSIARFNLAKRITENSYPGRGIVVGRDAAGDWIQVYWIMGRSENSRNRIFSEEETILRTEAADPSKVEDPSLIIYNAMRVSGKSFIVGNGLQVDALCEGLEKGVSFYDTLQNWEYEPDSPNFTPRISACIDVKSDSGLIWVSILKKDVFSDGGSERQYFTYDFVEPGFGYALTTYECDGDPLPSFSGSPYVVPVPFSEMADVADFYWRNLDEKNKISIAVRSIDSKQNQCKNYIINRYS
jgi:IMP cyclohydrolase